MTRESFIRRAAPISLVLALGGLLTACESSASATSDVLATGDCHTITLGIAPDYYSGTQQALTETLENLPDHYNTHHLKGVRSTELSMADGLQAIHLDGGKYTQLMPGDAATFCVNAGVVYDMHEYTVVNR